MKRLLLIIAAAVLLCGKVLAQQDTDTLSYPDWRYYYPPIDTAGITIFTEDNHERYASPGYLGNLQYKVTQPLRVYGIAVTPSVSTNGPIFLRTYHGNTIRYEPDPPDVDSSTLDLYAVLIQQEDSQFVHVDSVKWHKRSPDKYFRYRAYRGVVEDTVVPVYEFFFDTPHEVHDSFYVGFRSDYVRSPNFDQTAPCGGHSYPQQWAWELQFMGHVSWFTSNVDNYIRTWYNEGWAATRLGQRPLFRWGAEWGGIFPIIVPPDTDAVVGIPVSGFHRTEDYEGWPAFVWDRLPGQELFELSYGRADQDPDSFSVVGTTVPAYILRDSMLAPSVMYAARCRARHHHACALHDTLVWSEWTDTVHFMICSPDTQDVGGIRQAAAEVPTFTLSPNPAQDKVTVTLEHLAGMPCVVRLRDEQGRELLRQRMDTYPNSSSHPQEGTSLTLSTQGLAAGLYLVTLESPQGTSTQKLVIN